MARKYDAVFKEEAVKLSNEIGLPEAANQLGIPYQTLSEWRKKRCKNKIPADGKTPRERELEAKVAELTKTVEVLKDTIGFFAAGPKK